MAEAPEDLREPPAPPTEGQTLAIAGLDDDVSTFYKNIRVPWKVQALMCGLQYTTMIDVAERWPDKTELRRTGARVLGLVTGEGDGVRQLGFSEEDITRALMQLGVAADDAKRRVAQYHGMLAGTSTASASALITRPVRKSLETAFEDCEQQKPSLDKQGYTNFLGQFFKHVAEGYQPLYQLRSVVPFLPRPEHKVTKYAKRRRRNDGAVMEYETEEVDDPQPEKAWPFLLEGFRTTLPMCVYASPQQNHLAIHKKELGDFHNLFHGKDCTGTCAPPTLEVRKGG